jgi:hypothetical protein
VEPFNLACVEDTLWVVTYPTGVGAYDFDFECFFACRHPLHVDRAVRVIARMGAAQNYAQRFRDLSSAGIELIHTPDEYDRASQLPHRYPLISDMTPRSVWFSNRPSVADIEKHFPWPVFVKGQRQTNRHRRDQSIIEGPDQFRQLMLDWERGPILGWQRVVCREFVPLRAVAPEAAGAFPQYTAALKGGG